ncbi:unnamed protein product [[Actinomadura] parvosata subsp. kistnae]|uniref:tRNA-guanine(15) transglycosylase-like domain-containing protein n=1 Tax=[Actinomadura] parvosata subsp. kistnae TaxID=1909395 RepID=A0A1V0AI72_9ACTN|nr:hypothetical protein [Nonomuraea sp. ATCC 55076]AQZ69782.1 hypothetical protein BKM31_57405 [Nonomuraea sp. ATCC 55076]SPL90065.1 unnamed protein product [Actinomadura parvosata subsp. kistnae]
MDLHERLLIQVSVRDVYDATALAGHPRSGLVFTGQAGHDAIRMVRRAGYDGPLLADRRRYAGSARVRGTARLSADWIADQVEAGATAPLTDSGYISKGDHKALNSILDQSLHWEGAIAVLPVHARWVTNDRATLLRTIADYGSPVALVIEDGPPHRPLPFPLLSTGIAALGALAYGADWAAIGVREVLRHLYPEPHETQGGWRRGGARSAFVPDRLEFVPVERLGDGTCACSTCQGRPLRHLTESDELHVNTHNAKVLHVLHNRLLRSTHREHWWHSLTATTT